MKRLLLLLIVSISTVAMAQVPTVSGTLRAGNQAVPYANVALLRQADSTFVRGTTSDAQGRFSLDGDSVATLLRVSCIGYKTIFVAVSDSVASVNVGVLTLEEGATTLDAIEVAAAKPIYSVEGEKKLYNVSEDASVQAGTASDALQNAPGVQVDVQGNITLDGQSVTVWINDRPSHLDGESLKQYIKQLPANSISAIEVIKNPSAKYGGSGPVINIKTDRKVLKNSYVSLGANGSSEPSVVPWLSYVYANEKFRISAYVNYSRSHDENSSTDEGRMLDADSLTAREWTGKGSGESTRNHMNANLNFSYEFDTMNELSGWFYTYPSWSKDIRDSRFIRTDYIDGVAQDYSYTSHSDSRDHSGGGGGGLWFQHKFDNEGHQLSVNANGSWWGYGGTGTSFEHYDVQHRLDYDSRTDNNDISGWGSVGVDYSWPYSDKGEFEAGVDYSLSRNNEYEIRDTMDAAGVYHCDVLRSDTAWSPSDELSAYLSWRRKWGRFVLKVSGRVGYEVSSDHHWANPEFDTVVGHWEARPSVHLSYSTENMHNFSLSYSFSESTPSASRLSRYVSYGTDSYSTGNPDLKPYYSHYVDADWSKYFEKGHSAGISASLRSSNGEVESVSDPVWSDFFGRYVAFRKPYNAGDSRRLDVSANLMFRPSAMFNVRLYTGLTDSWYRIMVRPDSWVESEMAQWYVRTRLWTKLWNKLEVFASGYYYSRGHSWSMLSVSEPRKGIDLGMSADFFDRKLSLYLNVNDIFDWNNWATSSINPYFTSSNTYKYTSRYVIFGVTLRFGKMELGNRGQEGIQSTGGSQGGGGRN